MQSDLKISRLARINATLCIAMALVVIPWIFSRGGDWVSKLLLNSTYLAGFGAMLFVLALGTYYLTLRRELLIARIIFNMAVLQSVALLGIAATYLIPGLEMPFMDSTFARIEQSIGYDFPSFVQWAVANEWVQNLACIIYSEVTKLIVFTVVFYLVMTKRIEEFERIASFIVISVILTVMVAIFFPAGSVFAYYQIPLEAETKLLTAVGADYNLYYARVRAGDLSMLAEGFRGMVAFPSFHTVLGLMSVFYLRSNLWLMVPVAVLAALMIATTPLIGGHFLVDIVGGIVVALVSYRLVERLAREPEPSLVYATT